MHVMGVMAVMAVMLLLLWLPAAVPSAHLQLRARVSLSRGWQLSWLSFSPPLGF